jgi:two-component system sensor histidine kinase TctE
MPSLRARLLAWVMLPLAGAVALDGWIMQREALRTATTVQDRLLLGSARIMAEQVRWEKGAFVDQIPPAALELFQARVADRVVYRITAANGRLITGDTELPLPVAETAPEVPLHFDAQVHTQAARVVAYRQPVVGAPGVDSVLVEVAQTLNGRDAFARQLWSQSMAQQGLILGLTALLVLMGLRQGLRPLLRLRNAVRAREPGALQPLTVDGVATELAPLVEAINQYAQRLEHYTQVQQVFIQNAAHQLRTPFTALRMQLSAALRAQDEAARLEALNAIRQTVQQSVRLVNQLLTLSAADAASRTDVLEAVALDELVPRVLEDLAGHAQARGIDLGFECEAPCPPVAATALAAREIVVNLVDNAIRYTPVGGVVTARLLCTEQDRVQLTVEDNGPGIPAELRERVFERFFRVDDSESGGSGLGLPIVREFARRSGAQVALRTPDAGVGLAVDVSFTAATPVASAAGLP